MAQIIVTRGKHWWSRWRKKTTVVYGFPSHLSALEQIAERMGISVSTLLTRSLDQYLSEVGARDEGESRGARWDRERQRLR